MNKKPGNKSLAEGDNCLSSKTSATFNKTAEHGQSIKLRNKMTAKTGEAPTVAGSSGESATVANHKDRAAGALPSSPESEKPSERNIAKVDSPQNDSKQEFSKSQNGELKKKIYRSERAIKELKAAAQLKAQVKVNVTSLDKDVFQSAKSSREKTDDARMKSIQNRDSTSAAPDNLKSATGRPTLIRRHVPLNNLLVEPSNKPSLVNSSTSTAHNAHGSPQLISAQQTATATAGSRSFFDKFCPNLLMENSLNNNSTFQNSRTPGKQLKRSGDSNCRPHLQELPLLPSSSSDNQAQSSQLHISGKVSVNNFSHHRHNHQIDDLRQRSSKSKLPSENGLSPAAPSEALGESEKSSKTSASLSDENTSDDRAEALKNDHSPSTTFSTFPIRNEGRTTCNNNPLSQTGNSSPRTETKNSKNLVRTVKMTNTVSDHEPKTTKSKKPKNISLLKPCSKTTSKFFKKCLRQSKVKTWSLKKEKSLKQKSSLPDRPLKDKILNLKSKHSSWLTLAGTDLAKTNLTISSLEPLKPSFLKDSYFDMIKFKTESPDCNKHSGYDSDKTDIFDYDEDDHDATASGSKAKKSRDETVPDGGVRNEKEEKSSTRNELGSDISYDTTDEDLKVLSLAALNLLPTKDFPSLSEVSKQESPIASKKISTDFSESGPSTPITVDRSLSLTDSILKLRFKKRPGQDLFPEFELAKKKYKRSHRTDESKPDQKLSEKRWLREKKRHYFEYDSNELRACKKLSLLEAQNLGGLEEKITTTTAASSETSSESRSETPSSKKSADFKSETSAVGEQKKKKKNRLNKIHKKPSKLKFKEASRDSSLDSSRQQNREPCLDHPLNLEKHELSGKVPAAENKHDARNVRKEKEDRFKDKKENGSSVTVPKNSSNDAESMEVTLLAPEDAEDRKSTKKEKKHRKHKLAKVVDEVDIMVEKKEKGKSGRKKKRPVEETCLESSAQEKTSPGILSVSESVILSRELGPKFNWLEHKIQQNYKNNGSAGGGDSTVPSTAALTRPSLVDVTSAATTASPSFNSTSLSEAVATEEENNNTGLVVSTAEKKFRPNKAAFPEDQKVEKRQKIPSSVERAEKTMKESSLNSAKHFFALSTLRLSQHGDQNSALQRENKSIASAKPIRKDAVGEGIPISVFLNKFSSGSVEPDFQASSHWSPSSTAFSTLMSSSSSYATHVGSSSSEKLQTRQNFSKFDSAPSNQPLHALSNHHPHARDAPPIRTEIMSEKRLLTSDSQISARQPSFELSDPVLLQEYRQKFDNYLKIKQVSESKQKEILKLETEKERLKRELVSLLRMASEGKLTIPGSRQCKPTSVPIPSPPSIYAQKFLKKSAPVSPLMSSYPMPPSWSMGNSLPSDDLPSSRFEKNGGGLQSKTVSAVSHHYPVSSDLTQLHDKLHKQPVKLPDRLMYSQNLHPVQGKGHFSESSTTSSDVLQRKTSHDRSFSLAPTEQLFHQKFDKSVSRNQDPTAKDRPPPSAETLNYCYSVHKEFLEKAKNFTHSYESPQILLQSLTVVGKPKAQDMPTEKPLPLENKISTRPATPDVIITSARIGPSPLTGASRKLDLICDSSPFLHLRQSAGYQGSSSPQRATRSADTIPPEESKRLIQLPERRQDRPLDNGEKIENVSEKTALDLSVRVDQHRSALNLRQTVRRNRTPQRDAVHVDEAKNLSVEQEDGLVLDLRKEFSAPLDLKVKQTVNDGCRMGGNNTEIDYASVDNKNTNLLKRNDSELRNFKEDQLICETLESATKPSLHSSANRDQEQRQAAKNPSGAEPSLSFPEWYKENSMQSTDTADQNTMAVDDEDSDHDRGKLIITLEEPREEEMVESMPPSPSVDAIRKSAQHDLLRDSAKEKSEQCDITDLRGLTGGESETTKSTDILADSLLNFSESVSEQLVSTKDEFINTTCEPEPVVLSQSATSSPASHFQSVTSPSKSLSTVPLSEATYSALLEKRESDSKPPPLSSVRSKSCDVTGSLLVNDRVPSNRSKSASLVKAFFSISTSPLASICQNSNSTEPNASDETQASATDLSVKELVDESCLKDFLPDNTLENSKPDSLSSILNSLRAEEAASPVRNETLPQNKEDERVSSITQTAVEDNSEDALLNLSLRPKEIAVTTTVAQTRSSSTSASLYSQFAMSPLPVSRAGLSLKAECLSKSPDKAVNQNDNADEIASNNSMMMMMMMMMPKGIETLDSEKFNAQLDETIKKELQNSDKTDVMPNSVDLTSVLSSPKMRNISPAAMTTADHSSRFIEIKRSNSVEEIGYQLPPFSRRLSPPLTSQMALSSRERDDLCLSSDRKHSLASYQQRDHQLQLTTAAARQQYQLHEHEPPQPSISLQQFHHPSVPITYAGASQQSSSHHPSQQRHQQKYQQQKYSQNVLQQLQLQLHHQQLELHHRSQHPSQAIKVSQPAIPDNTLYPKRQGARSDHDQLGVSSNQDKYAEHVQRKLIQNQPDFLHKQRHFIVENGHDGSELTYYNQLQPHPNIPQQVRQQNLHHYQQLQQHPSVRPCTPPLRQVIPQRAQQQQELQRLHSQQKNLKYPPQPALNAQFVHPLGGGGGVGAETQDLSQVYLKPSLPSPRVRETSFRFKNLSNTMDTRGYQQHLSSSGFPAGPSQPLVRRQELLDAQFLKHPSALKHLHEASKQQQEQLIHKVDTETLRYHQKQGRHYERLERFDPGLQPAGRPPPYYKIYNEPSLHMAQGRLPQDHHNFRPAVHPEFDTRNQVAKGLRGIGSSPPSAVLTAAAVANEVAALQSRLAEEPTCFNCPRPAHFICSTCKNVYYCSRDCQAKSWEKGHKDECRPSNG